jgi:predicted outer membrane repeat protein
MRNSQCSPKLTNCIFSSNTADWGGAIYNYQSDTTFTNCTFAGNQAKTQGGVMNNYSSSKPTLANCILWAIDTCISNVNKHGMPM